MFRTTLIAAAATLALLGTQAAAATLNGVFEINIKNFAPSDAAAADRRLDSFATRSNFDSAQAGAIDATVTYTGDLDFNAGASTIASFLNSGSGSYTVDFGTQAFLDATTLSAGSYNTTTFFEIMGTFAGNATNGVIFHDDGVTLEAINQTGGVSAPPTTAIPTNFTADAGAFTLLYAAANGNPSILKVTADISPVPLPAGAVLLLTGLAGLGVARRRKTAA